MDHDAALEQLELAALEPGGIDRLIAGDTPTAQAAAGHLAGCPACTDELVRLQRASRLIAAAIREAPPPDLRDRTLARVRALGRPRGTSVNAEGPATVASLAGLRSGEARPVVFAPARWPSGRRVVVGWIAAIAAAVLLCIGTTSFLIGGRVDERLAQQTETIRTLEEVTTATLRVTAQQDARHVVLTGTSNPDLDGTLVFSPSSTELVVVTTGLTAPPAGQEYRCWVEDGGQRQPVGKMFFSDDLAYWIGPAPAISNLSSTARFGVSLVDASGAAVDAAPVLGGSL